MQGTELVLSRGKPHSPPGPHCTPIPEKVTVCGGGVTAEALW